MRQTSINSILLMIPKDKFLYERQIRKIKYNEILDRTNPNTNLNINQSQNKYDRICIKYELNKNSDPNQIRTGRNSRLRYEPGHEPVANPETPDTNRTRTRREPRHEPDRNRTRTRDEPGHEPDRNPTGIAIEPLPNFQVLSPYSYAELI